MSTVAGSGSESYFGSAQQGELRYDLKHDFRPEDLDRMLFWARECYISDLTLQSNDYITAQIQGRWQAVSTRRLENNEIEQILAWKADETAPGFIQTGRALNFRLQASIDRDNVLAFRAAARRCRVGSLARGLSITLRTIPGEPPAWSTLGMPDEITESYFPRDGLVLLVAATGQGKTTTMASGIDRILRDTANPRKVGTVEDPIEFTFGDAGLGHMPLITQMEIGLGNDLLDWDDAGPMFLRNKFDVLVMGEMNNAKTVRTGLQMGSTGHAVYATLHTNTPDQAIDRMVKFFAEGEQPSAAATLVENMRLVVAQKLAINTKGTRTAFRSWLTFDREVVHLLNETPYQKWLSLLTRVMQDRRTTFEHQALPALQSGLITFGMFRELTNMTRRESMAFFEKEGFDASALA